MESHRCRRCGETKLVNEDNWYRQRASKTGYDLTKCKVCGSIYQRSRRAGTWQRRAPKSKPRKRPATSFELSCIKYKVKLASEPTISILQDI